MKSKRALLVDMDGTLVDTANANYAAYSIALTEVGVRLTKKEFEDISYGKNWKQFLPQVLTTYGINVPPEKIADRKAIIYADMMGDISVNTALVKLIEFSRPLFKTALVTTASSKNVHHILKHHYLDNLFDVVITGNDVMRHKPDPECYRIAAERLGVQCGDCIVFEDTELGIASAKAFGALVLEVNMISR
jgi:beta-phosphoglucomutase